MEILINGLLLSARLTGIGYYIQELVRALPGVLGAGDAVTVVVPRDYDPGHLPEHPQMRYVQVNVPAENPARRILWEQTAWPAMIRRGAYDVVHSPAYALPVLGARGAVVTVHDLAFRLYPYTFNRGNRTYLSLITRRAVQVARLVIATSENTKRDLLQVYQVPEDKVVVVPNGVDARYAPVTDQGKLSAVRERYALPERFILYVGTIEPRKNLTTLVRAFARLRASGTDSCQLVIAGKKGWLYDEVFETVKQLGLESSVRFLGYVEHAHLPALYSLADVFAYLSVYEGFGLPPLEAMACGTPVVAAAASSIPEVMGSAGLLVPPTDEAAVADALRRVLEDGALREQLRQAGLAQAARFSWRMTAQQTMEVYRRVAGGME